MNLLSQPHPPWTLRHLVPQEEESTVPSHLYRTETTSPVVRVLRGKKMRSLSGLMSEFGAALQFFGGFGENWNALNECLCYMDEWLPASAYVLVFTSPEEILADESAEETRWLLVTLDEVGLWWSKPIENNGRFNRPPVPFHAVMQYAALWKQAGPSRLAYLPLLR